MKAKGKKARRQALPGPSNLSLAGWFMMLARDSHISKVIVFKRQRDDRWKRLHAQWDSYPPFDQDFEPLFETYGDGGYRFVAVSGGHLARTRSEEIGGYGFAR